MGTIAPGGPASGKVGLIGLGMMGYPMASRIHHAGRRLAVFDTLPSSVEKFCSEHPGAEAARDIESLEGAAVMVLMLPNSSIVDATVLGSDGKAGLIDILGAGTTVIDMGSSQPMRSQELSRLLAQRGMRFLDAPVSGGVKRAIDGSLAIMVGGERSVYDDQQELFRQLGKVITHVGPAGAGHAMKALNNLEDHRRNSRG